MHKRLSLIRLRRSATVRILTVLLLVLAVSPFTAPFSTFDLGVHRSVGRVTADLPSSDKKMQDDVTIAVVNQTCTSLIVAPLGMPAAAGEVESRKIPALVLRL